MTSSIPQGSLLDVLKKKMRQTKEEMERYKDECENYNIRYQNEVVRREEVRNALELPIYLAIYTYSSYFPTDFISFLYQYADYDKSLTGLDYTGVIFIFLILYHRVSLSPPGGYLNSVRDKYVAPFQATTTTTSANMANNAISLRFSPIFDQQQSNSIDFMRGVSASTAGQCRGRKVENSVNILENRNVKKLRLLINPIFPVERRKLLNK